MKKTVYTLFAIILPLIAMTILFSSSSNGRAFAANSGNTGAPGEATTCGSCHSGGSYGATTYSIELLDSSNNAVSSYTPGSVYTLRGTFITPTGNPVPSGYGFQVVTLLSNNASYNAWTSPSSNARIATASNGRSYTEQAGPSGSSTFSVNWTAPPVGSGSIRFFSASNAVNLNRNTGGDNGFTDQLVITENISTGSEDLVISNFIFYPNPVKDQLFIENLSSSNSTLLIYDQTGKVVRQELILGKKANLQLEELPNGIYFIQLSNPSGITKTSKLVKK